MGLTKTGYIRRTYDDILNDKIRRAKELFGEDIETSDATPLGKFLRISAYDLAKAEEEIEAVYYARFPNTASGQSLDRLMVFAGITRNPATAAVYSVNVYGTAGYEIPAGFLIGTETEITYWTAQAYVIGDDEKCTIAASCTEAGTIGNLGSAGAINRVMNPDVNITRVEGVECLKAGTDAESDVDLRARFASAVSSSGSCNENAIAAAILRVPTVRYAQVISNTLDEADAEGRPPHSFECYVLGGDDYEQEIAEAIFSKRPIGIQTVGDKTVTILDVSGTERTVKFSPARMVDIVVRISLRKNATFPDDGVHQVQENVADYINSRGFGESLILSSLYGHIYGVSGVAEVTILELSTDGGSTFNSGNVDVSEYGIASCSEVIVEVNA